MEFRGDVRRIGHFLRDHELLSKKLAFFGVLCGALWGFFEVTDEVLEGESKALDESIIMAFRTPGDPSDPLGPVWVEQMARDITSLGGYTVIGLVTLFTVGLLLLLKKKLEALFCALAVSSGIALIHFLKIGFDRPRPDLVSHNVAVSTASFPSGHSLISFLAYLSLALLATQTLPSKRTKIYVVGMSLGWASLIAVSRVYLGVHWPSDVLAGCCLGIFWALLWSGLERKFKPSA